MHINLESDYAVRIVYCLAQKKERLDAASISEITGVTLRFSLKILRKLVAGDIVKSFKGAKGGYELAKNPGDISMREVVEAVEGTYVLSRCLNENYTCEHAMKTCPFIRVFEDISTMVREKLSEVTFADL